MTLVNSLIAEVRENQPSALELCSEMLREEESAALREILAVNTSLRSLKMIAWRFHEKGATKLANALKTNSNL
jgi:hypothetical protein